MRRSRKPKPQAEPVTEFVLAGVIEDAAVPDVFTLVAFLADDVGLLAEHFPGRETRMMELDVLAEHARAEVRALLEMNASDGKRDGVVIGTTDGQGGWSSWNLGFFAPKPPPLFDLLEPRLLDVLRDASDGLTQPELAASLGLDGDHVTEALQRLRNRCLVEVNGNKSNHGWVYAVTDQGRAR